MSRSLWSETIVNCLHSDREEKNLRIHPVTADCWEAEYKVCDEFVTDEDFHIVGKHCSRSFRKLADTGLHVA